MNPIKKSLGLMGCILLTTVLLAGCSQNANSKASSPPAPTGENQTVTGGNEKETAFNVGVIPDYPPFSFDNKGTPSGICIDILNEASKRQGIQVNLHMIPFNRALESVKDGSLDAMVPIYETIEREAFLDYVKEPLVPDSNSIFVRSDSSITYNGDLNTLKAHTIGVVFNNSYGDDFDEAVKKGLLKTEGAAGIDGIINKLIGHRQDFIVGGTFAVLYTAKTLGVSDQIKELKPVISNEFIKMSFSKQSTHKDFMEKYNTAFEEMKKDGTLEAILSKYK